MPKSNQRSWELPVLVDVIYLCTNEEADVVTADCDQHFVTGAIEGFVVVSVDLEKLSTPGTV